MTGTFPTTFRGVFLAVAITLGGMSAPVLAEDSAVEVPSDDAAMTAAIAKARAELPQFWEALAKPEADTEGYALKVAIHDGANVEHFWASDIEQKDGKITAVIANEPELVTTVKEGQRVDVPESDISDWMFFRKGKIVGNETMRALLIRLPAEEAEQYRAMLETP